jgi:pantoate--beta-alanine ligase
MKIIERVREMKSWSETQRHQGRRVVLVPTMGFLHQGHLSLVRDGRKRGDQVVVSIFVNPAQFAPEEDFAAYPRDFERDRKLLEEEGVDVLFHPPLEAIYPEGYQTHIEVENLSLPLCGAFRRGHFRGVATAVTKFFNIVRPHAAVFGCKDYQQLQVIRRLVADLNYDIEIIGYPTVREPDGLAISSRNAYLDPDERRAALCLSRSLHLAESLVRQGERRATALLLAVRAEVAKETLARLEYASLCDPESLQEVDQIRRPTLLALAARIGKARLIDNAIIKP